MDDPSTRIWKEASSVILVADEKKKPLVNCLEYLVTRRSDDHPVLPKSICFPGGTASAADSSSEWESLYEDQGYNIHEMKFMQPSAHLPQIYQEEYNNNNNHYHDDDTRSLTRRRRPAPKQVSLRLTAIRETFEECGILLCTQSQPHDEDESDEGTNHHHLHHQDPFTFENESEVKYWQGRVRKDPGEFINLCKSLFCLPNLHSLYEWSNWCSPSNTAVATPNRFDTMFYMAFFPHPLPSIIDPREVAYAQWMPAEEIIDSHESGRHSLPPPQFYEMTRLRGHTSLRHLEAMASLRQQLGLERWCPLYYVAEDAFVSCLPGDELYDEKLLDDGLISPNFPVIKDPTDTTSQQHRIEIRGRKKFKAVINIPYRFGQCYDNLQSNL